MIIWSLKGPRCSLVLWGFLKTSSLHLKNSFWSPWKYRVHERSGGELWSGAGAAGSRTGEDTQGPIIFIMYSIRPSRQSAVFLEVRAPRLQIYSEPWLPSNKMRDKKQLTLHCFSPSFCFSIWGVIKDNHWSQHRKKRSTKFTIH